MRAAPPGFQVGGEDEPDSGVWGPGSSRRAALNHMIVTIPVEGSFRRLSIGVVANWRMTFV